MEIGFNYMAAIRGTVEHSNESVCGNQEIKNEEEEYMEETEEEYDEEEEA